MSRGTTARDARSPPGYSPHGCRSEKSLRVSQCEETRHPWIEPRTPRQGASEARSMSGMAMFHQRRIVSESPTTYPATAACSITCDRLKL